MFTFLPLLWHIEKFTKFRIHPSPPAPRISNGASIVRFGSQMERKLFLILCLLDPPHNNGFLIIVSMNTWSVEPDLCTACDFSGGFRNTHSPDHRIHAAL